MRPPAQTIGALLDMLTYQRRAGGAGEAAFIKRYLSSIGATADPFGNLRVEVDPDNTRTLFSCHTDSVHPTAGRRQRVLVDEARQEAFKDDRHALGADDATGIWLMLHLLHLGVPGVYIFHREEEVGGNGSAWIAKHDRGFLSRFDRAIAFDRRGVSDVVTHQMGMRCASQAFGVALAHSLGGAYRPDDSGVFTDTANYEPYVPECVNISVGYDCEHTRHETQDLAHAVYLRDVLPSVQWEELPTARDPDALPPLPTHKAWWERGGSDDDRDDYGDAMSFVDFADEDEALEYLTRYPDEAARLLLLAYPGD